MQKVSYYFLVVFFLSIFLVLIYGEGAGSISYAATTSNSSVKANEVNETKETEETFQAHEKFTSGLLEQFKADSKTMGEQAAREVLINSLKNNSTVASATLEKDGTTIEVKFTTGLVVYLFAYDRD